jgi:outer membrane protein with beta-barrel domain
MPGLSRRVIALLCVSALGVTTAAAQEPGGHGRAELGAFPGGGVLFASSASGREPDFTNYTFGASFTWNVNSWAGVETEAGFGLGGRKTVTFDGQTFRAQAMPDTISYSGNLVINPFGGRRAFVPYAVAGVGAFRLVQRDGTEALGIVETRTLLAGSAGGGLKWYAAHAWGLRADYRLMVVRGDHDAPLFFGGHDTRYGHRLYASIFTTF